MDESSISESDFEVRRPLLHVPGHTRLHFPTACCNSKVDHNIVAKGGHTVL